MMNARSWILGKLQLTPIVFVCLAVSLAAPGLSWAHGSKGHEGKGEARVQWVNHFDLLSGDPSVTTTSSLSTNSGVGGGLTALVIGSSTTGDVDSFGGNKVVQMALELQPKTRIVGVRLCYELSDPGASGSYVDQIRLAQVQNPPSSALVLLDDATAQNASGPTCVDSALASPPIQAANGSVLLSLRVNFSNVADLIAIRAVGLLVNPD